ncbi:L-lactate dehydrogenase 1 [Clostridium pasteurianum DSM 525 = ATCC 6013]|uniref:L-lactate dehydrogenase n=1 Tax=Clostridium pasteurianum DSM 525 = ATCC 6013 TaxID=1262449 RepID=A0A0H3J2Y8_CLOPA|nr:L-lactate dehydrogenase [Clostridium pasteurianum]AJA47824.1 L-lactate dehydrogenase 1 [Clostridium pasteurianum DSM 525 = ATCC 6013]AJA51812.1 L-lactate dehydrogenase 1 [Clostridium pasteurianum DSM 525 = ATCC 6013]AOZ75115.1 L-lactate dehydrogenase [Clostridium pasteurianum DSM 525 = ATCC 6013]AOZ78910.1 L-lactate dehydrogenase [Clostridium pasteurianum]ELP59725.1 L-lactate dehydrogenase [Clostridium pasteurianum DSM 525 = ATCC 6013]
MKTTTKISIIGAGFVGSTTAFAIMDEGLASEIVIVDINKDKAEGEAMDLSHGASFVKPTIIKSGDYKDTDNSDIVIITAGAPQKPGETRLDLINKNYKIMNSIVPEVVKYSPNSILLIVSNPVDILAYIAYKISGFPKERVIGSGTVLDTSRFKYMLSDHFNVDARNIHTYIMGEHGDSEIATWSITNIAGLNISEYCSKYCDKCDGNIRYEIHEKVKNAAYEIINKKGATYYAVALAIRRIVEAILRDENSILTISTLLNGQYGIKEIYLGVPSIVGAEGVKNIVESPLNEEELSALKTSADKLKKSLDEALK